MEDGPRLHRQCAVFASLWALFFIFHLCGDLTLCGSLSVQIKSVKYKKESSFAIIITIIIIIIIIILVIVTLIYSVNCVNWHNYETSH